MLWRAQNCNDNDYEKRSHLVFLLEQVPDVLELVAVHGLEVLRGVTHGDHLVRDVGEVQVVTVLDEPPFLLWHKGLDRVGHCHPPRHSPPSVSQAKPCWRSPEFTSTSVSKSLDHCFSWQLSQSLPQSLNLPLGCVSFCRQCLCHLRWCQQCLC